MATVARLAASAGEEVGETVGVGRRQIERAAAQDLEGLFALVLVEVLHEQDAVEVVELVLEDPPLELGRLNGDFVPSRSRPTRCTALGRTISQLRPGTERHLCDQYGKFIHSGLHEFRPVLAGLDHPPGFAGHRTLPNQVDFSARGITRYSRETPMQIRMTIFL